MLSQHVLKLEKTSIDDLDKAGVNEHPYSWFPFISDPVLRSEESGKLFTLLLFSRATNPPHRFATVDALSPLMAMVNYGGPHEMSRFWYGMRIFLKSEEIAQGESKYGEIVPFQKSFFASGRCLPARVGAKLLYIQARIYSFLVLALKGLFANREEMKDIDSLKPRESSATLALNSKHIVTHTSDPLFFRVNGQVKDIEDIIQKIQDKISQAADHIQDLRDKPKDFKLRFDEMLAHQPESSPRGTFRKVAGETHPKFFKHDLKDNELDGNIVRLAASKYKV